MAMKRKELNPQYNRSKFNPYKLISIVILIFLALFAIVILTAPNDNTNETDNLPADNTLSTESETISFEDYAYLSQKIDQYTNYTAEDITVSYSNYNSQDGVMIAEGTYIRNGYMIEYKALVYDNGEYEINEY